MPGDYYIINFDCGLYLDNTYCGHYKLGMAIDNVLQTTGFKQIQKGRYLFLEIETNDTG